MHLIGPRYFDVYVTLLKMIIPIAAVISLISMFAEYFISYGGEEAVMNVVLSLMGEGIWRIIDVGIQTFFWLTIVFAVLERTDKGKEQVPLSTSLTKWKPVDLKNIPHIPKKKAISKVEVFGSLLWTAIWATLYFYANQLLGVYEGGAGRLEFVLPALNQEVLLNYWLLVLIVIGLDIALALYQLIKGKWTKKMVNFNAFVELIGTVVFIIILSNPNLLHPDFISHMTESFSITADQLEVWTVGGAIAIFIIFAVINVFEGYRKSKIQ